MTTAESLYRELRLELIAGVLSSTGVNRDEAEDAVQFAFVQFLRYEDRLHPMSLGGWLRVVARHEALLAHRRPLQLKRTGSVSDDSAHEWIALRDALDGLRPNQRTALTCRLLGLSYAEAAQATGRTYTWLNRHTAEGREALRA